MVKNKGKLSQFLKSQKLLVLASQDKDIWVANIFYGIADDFKFYFISNEETKHSRQIIKNSSVAFSVAWFNDADHSDRKGVQGQGKCRTAENDEEIKKGIELHNQNFPEFAERITPEWIKSLKNKSRVWVIKPTYIKYWDDGLYGQDEFEEFNFK